MELRQATLEDYEAIIRLVPSAEELFLVYPKGTHPFTVSQLHALAEIRKELTVVIQNTTVIGFANLYGLQPNQYVFIGNVVVSNGFRGQGIGKRLITHMTNVAFEKYQVPEIRISVFNENTPALLLYSSLGFKPYAIEERKHPLGQRVALIHMRKSRNTKLT